MEDGWRALRGLLGPGVCFSSFWPDSNNFFLSLPPAVAHEHLKERGLFGLPAAGTNASDYYHQMTLMAGHPAPYGDLLMHPQPGALGPCFPPPSASSGQPGNRLGMQPWALSLPDKELCLREALAVCTPPAPEPSAKRPGS